MEALAGFWTAVDEAVQTEMTRHTRIPIKRSKHECMWDDTGSVIYSAEKMKLQITAKTLSETLHVHLTMTDSKSSCCCEFKGDMATCSDLKTITDGEDSFELAFGMCMRHCAIHMAIQLFCRTEGYTYHYAVSKFQHGFFIYRPNLDLGAVLRIYIGYGTEGLGYVLFYEKFYLAPETHPDAFKPYILFSNTQQLWDIIRLAFKARPVWTVKLPCQFWNEIKDRLNSVPFPRL